MKQHLQQQRAALENQLLQLQARSVALPAVADPSFTEATTAAAPAPDTVSQPIDSSTATHFAEDDDMTDAQAMQQLIGTDTAHSSLPLTAATAAYDPLVTTASMDKDFNCTVSMDNIVQHMEMDNEFANIEWV